MNETRDRLVAVLRAEATEAAMSTDSTEQYDLLTARLDDVDRSRTRTRWVLAAAAAVVVGGLVWVFSGQQPAPSAPPAGPAPTASASTAVDPFLAEGLRRHWTTSVGPEDAAAALAGTAYEGDVAEIFAGLAEYHDATVEEAAQQTWQFDMYIDGRQASVYVRDIAGKSVRIDQFDYDLPGGTRMAASSVLEPGSVENAVYDIDLQGTSLRMTWVSGSATGGAPADANEGPKRVLYTSTTWTAADIGGPSPTS